MNLKKKLKKYTEVISIAQNELFASPSNYIARLFIHALRISVFGIIYSFVFNESGITTIDGFTAVNAVWSLALVQIIYQCSRNTFTQIKDEILSGQIETKLNKPYSFIVFSFLDAIGQAPAKFLGFAAVTIAVLITFFGVPDFSIIQLVGFLPLFILGLILQTLNLQLIALSAFWIENPDPVFWITSKLTWIVNGTFVPLAILPIAFRTVSDSFPLSAPFFMGRIFEINSISDLGKFLLIQLVWIMIIMFFIRIAYRKGITKVSINGG